MAVANVVPIWRTMPITPGTKKFGLRIVGLYSIWGRISTGTVRRPVSPIIISTDWVSATPRAVLSACNAVVEFEPSIKIWTAAG